MNLDIPAVSLSTASGTHHPAEARPVVIPTHGVPSGYRTPASLAPCSLTSVGQSHPTKTCHNLLLSRHLLCPSHTRTSPFSAI